MAERTQQLPFHPRLGRHVRHDPRSMGYPAETALPTRDVRHRRVGLKLDQDSVGACTGFALAHCFNTGLHRRELRAKGQRRTLRHEHAMSFYSGATRRDPWQGEYPPTDTGSSGLAVAQEAQAQGFIVGYDWGFGLHHSLGACVIKPGIQGSWWTDDMFRPSSSGEVRPTGGDRGGHEYLFLGFETDRKRSWFFNSWGEDWGLKGYFWMSWDNHALLLDRQGDVLFPRVS